jgi:hypothetical protein
MTIFRTEAPNGGWCSLEMRKVTSCRRDGDAEDESLGNLRQKMCWRGDEVTRRLKPTRPRGRLGTSVSPEQNGENEYATLARQ